VSRTEQRPLWRRLVLPVVTIAGLFLVAPVLADVYGSLGDIGNLGLGWKIAMVVASAGQLVAFWELHRIVLRTDRWFDIAAPHLVGNAASHLAPGGSAVGAGVQARLMTKAGFSLARTMTAFGAIAILGGVANFVVLPLVVLAAAAAGTNIDAGLISAMWMGVGILAASLVIAVFVITRDAPWRRLARVVSWFHGRLRRASDVVDLERRLIQERNLIRAALRGRAASASFAVVGSALGDFAVLYFALRAVGAEVNPAAALAAFVVSNVAGMIPLTPGGLGFVEAGMTGVLTVAGATNEQALLAVAAYRLVATWLPCLGGAVAFVWFKWRHHDRAPRELLTPV
jgi:uncharacterized protein (TIRG00374 family)